MSRSLTENDLQYWQQKAHYFEADKNKGSFYYHGTSGLIAWWFKNFLNLTPTLKADLKKIFSSTSLEEQKEKYVGIERKIFSPFFQWLTSRHTVLTMAGVPRAQRNLIQADNPGGVKSFIFPLENQKDYEKFMEKYKDNEIIKGIDFYPIRNIHEAIDLIFE